MPWCWILPDVDKAITSVLADNQYTPGIGSSGYKDPGIRHRHEFAHGEREG
jgi:hypothetical protein